MLHCYFKRPCFLYLYGKGLKLGYKGLGIWLSGQSTYCRRIKPDFVSSALTLRQVDIVAWPICNVSTWEGTADDFQDKLVSSASSSVDLWIQVSDWPFLTRCVR